MTAYKWSQTAASNATADATINWAEGQAPSSVNNSARAMMAALAKLRDDVGGNLLTTGTSTAYAVTSNQDFTALTDGIFVTARMHATNGAASTFSPDALAAKPIHSVLGTAIPAGTLLEGSVQSFVYDLSTDAWIVHGSMVPTAVALSGLQIHEATEVTSLVVADEIAVYDDSATANRRATFASVITSFEASETVGGFVEQATSAEVYAATSGAKAIMAQDLETASAFVALTDAAPVAVNWDAGINFSLTVTASRAIGNPTNGQPGTWRTILVQGNDATDRTITFGNQFLGDVPVITDCDSTRWYLIMILCVTASHFVASSKRAAGSA